MIINSVQFNVELEDILAELITQLRTNGIELIAKQKEGPTHIQICCPYHNGGKERRPSAGIRKEDGLFHCFACGEVHSLQEVISYCFGHTDDVIGVFGWKWLLKNFATVQVEERKDVELDFARNSRTISVSGNNSDIDGHIHYIGEKELDSYRYTHPYMYERGLTDEIIDLFNIGYDKDTRSITFPVRDIQGNCLFVARRSVQSKFYNYPKGVEKPLYGLYEYNQEYYSRVDSEKELNNRYEVIVCEGMFDALSCWVYGKYAVALNGTGNELQFKQLRELPCRKLILATDNDSAGIHARNRIRRNVPNKLISEYVLPDGKKDINDLTQDEFSSLLEVF